MYQTTNNVISIAHNDGYGSRVINKCEIQAHLNEGFRTRMYNDAIFKALISLCTEGRIGENMEGDGEVKIMEK